MRLYFTLHWPPPLLSGWKYRPHPNLSFPVAPSLWIHNINPVHNHHCLHSFELYHILDLYPSYLNSLPSKMLSKSYSWWRLQLKTRGFKASNQCSCSLSSITCQLSNQVLILTSYSYWPTTPNKLPDILDFFVYSPIT